MYQWQSPKQTSTMHGEEEPLRIRFQECHVNLMKHVAIVPHVSQHASSCLLLLAIVPPLHMGGRTLGLHALRNASSSEARDNVSPCQFPGFDRQATTQRISNMYPLQQRQPGNKATTRRLAFDMVHADK